MAQTCRVFCAWVAGASTDLFETAIDEFHLAPGLTRNPLGKMISRGFFRFQHPFKRLQEGKFVEGREMQWLVTWWLQAFIDIYSAKHEVPLKDPIGSYRYLDVGDNHNRIGHPHRLISGIFPSSSGWDGILHARAAADQRLRASICAQPEAGPT